MGIKLYSGSGSGNLKINNDPSLVGWWMLDATDLARDKTKYLNNGTGAGGITIGGATNHRGRTNGATNFVSASSQYISLPNQIISQANIWSNGLTITAWVYLTSLGTLQGITGQMGQTNYSYWSSGGLYISADNKAQMTIYTNGNGYVHLKGSTNLLINTVYFIVGTYNPSDQKIRIYLNGLLENTSVTLSGGLLDATNLGHSIGRGYEQGPGLYYLNGSIDDIRFYSYGLETPGVKQLYLQDAISKIVM